MTDPMKTIVPIKSDLFRFITLRTPDHLTQQGRQSRFLFHPDISKSAIRECPFMRPGVDVTVEQIQQFLKSFDGKRAYQDIRAVKPDLYDFADGYLRSSMQRRIDADTAKKLQLSDSETIWLFDQLFYQLLTRESDYVRQASVQMLLAQHCLINGLYQTEEGRLQTLSTKIVIPQQVLNCLKAWRGKQCEGKLSGVNNLGIADFRRVEQEVCCYVPGEVSHIENILAREYKERHTRNLVRTDISTEITQEVETEKLSDVTTASRNEVTTEIASVLNENQSSNYGGSLGVSSEIFGAQINANAFANFANAQSSTLSNQNAQLYAQEVTKRAVERILQRTTEKRTSRVIKEFEENNKHGFDNRNGDQHVTGIYRWVDIIYTNRLVNYGKRLMFEFLVPEPATFFKRIQALTPPPPSTGGPLPIPPVKPITLVEQEVLSFRDITRDNYADLGAVYGVLIPQPPSAQVSVAQSFSPNPALQHNSTAWTQTSQVSIPNDY